MHQHESTRPVWDLLMHASGILFHHRAAAEVKQNCLRLWQLHPTSSWQKVAHCFSFRTKWKVSVQKTMRMFSAWQVRPFILLFGEMASHLGWGAPKHTALMTCLYKQDMMIADYGSWCWKILSGSAHIVGHDRFHKKQTHINYRVIST